MDVHRFQDTLARARRNSDAVTDLGTVLADWRGPAYPMHLGERGIAARAEAALRNARAEHAGAASGMLTLGPVALPD